MTQPEPIPAASETASRTDRSRPGDAASGTLRGTATQGTGNGSDRQEAHLPSADSELADRARIEDAPDSNSAKLAAIASLEPDMCRVLGHPLRSRIFWRLGDGPGSAGDLAREFGVPEQQIRDQIKVLKKHGLVELVQKRPGERGGRRYIYRAVDRLVVKSRDWATIPPSVQDSTETEITRKLHGEMVRALEARTLQSDPDHVLIRRPTLLDLQGKKRVDSIMLAALDLIIEAERESAERSAETGDNLERTIQGMTSFVAAPAEASAGDS